MIYVNELNVIYNERHALNGVNLTLGDGRLIVLVGANGSGKTTLLRCLAGLIKPIHGQINVDDIDLATLNPSERAQKIAYLPQERSIAWDLTVLEIAALGGIFQPRDLAMQNAIKALKELGLSKLSHQPISILSGGQKSRVLLARLWVSQAHLLLLDEPLIGLDPSWQRQVLQDLKSQSARGKTIIISLHDLSLAAAFADEIIVLKEGVLLAHGEPDEEFTPDLLQQGFQLKGYLSDGALRLENTTFLP